MPAPRKKNKKSSVFSHEFIITNHGDIVSCVCMLFMVGLLFKATQKVASVFVGPQHNITRYNNDTGEVEATHYAVGKKDICTIFFYSLAWIVIHAIIQEYILDKINRKFHLSKTKISRFNNLGGHIPFYFASAAWGADIILKESLLPKLSNLWHGYPHIEMTFMVKFYFLLQIAYWIHCFPELYFLKAKKEDLVPRINMYLQYLVILIPAYMCNFTRLALVCFVIHYCVECLFNAIKIMNYMGKTETSKNTLVIIWALFYIAARIAVIILSIVTIWIGLPKQDSSDRYDIVPNFNKKPLRYKNCLALYIV
ncbi:Translocating chain-associated membrane 1-like 1 [Paramuricea clavata]|uniref:Translocating chain-associated membrane 1-like 1 n=1 Tax=Paramuricea clavata TaxID=317549 RepID=A0A7D9DGF1_PARCT|nr:Translocating chain-associated membrane 1-like 1 [Paramuricea clavata]